MFINHPNAPEKTRAFAFGLIRALFPEWADRVTFRQAPQDYGSLGHVPQPECATAAADLARQLIRSDQVDQAEAILRGHADLMARGAPLHQAQADLHRTNGSDHAELLSLHEAWLAGASDWRILARMIWAARKFERLDILAWAKAQLTDRFPDRCIALARDRPWLRDLG